MKGTILPRYLIVDPFIKDMHVIKSNIKLLSLITQVYDSTLCITEFLDNFHLLYPSENSAVQFRQVRRSYKALA